MYRTQVSAAIYNSFNSTTPCHGRLPRGRRMWHISRHVAVVFG